MSKPITIIPAVKDLGTLSFGGFGYVNWKRHKEWPKDPAVPAENWTTTEWAVAVAEETGELCGAVKRLNRFHKGYVINRRESRVESVEEGREKMKREMGDIVIYLDLMAQSEGFSLEECIREAFNSVSEREGLPHRL